MLGILGLPAICCCLPVSPVAVIIATKALKEVDLQPALYANRGTLVTAQVLGYIGSAFWVVYIGLLVVFSAFGG